MAKWARVRDHRIIELSDVPITIDASTTTGDITVQQVNDDAQVGDEVTASSEEGSASAGQAPGGNS